MRLSDIIFEFVSSSLFTKLRLQIFQNIIKLKMISNDNTVINRRILDLNKHVYISQAVGWRSGVGYSSSWLFKRLVIQAVGWENG